jgi:hypothetical protein
MLTCNEIMNIHSKKLEFIYLFLGNNIEKHYYSFPINRNVSRNFPFLKHTTTRDIEKTKEELMNSKLYEK